MARADLRAVTLDAYGTLFDIDSQALGAVEAIVAAQGLDACPECISRAWTERFFALLGDYDRDGDKPGPPEFRTIRELTTDSLAEVFDRLGVAGDVPRAVDVWFEHVRELPLFPEVRAAVVRLAGRYRLAVVSDADDDFLAPAIERAGLPVEVVLSSESARSYKIEHDSPLFARAFEALGCEPGEVAHVGDSVADVLGAMRSGARAVWLSRDGRKWTDERAEPEFIARDLAETAAMLCGDSGNTL